MEPIHYVVASEPVGTLFCGPTMWESSRTDRVTTQRRLVTCPNCLRKLAAHAADQGEAMSIPPDSGEREVRSFGFGDKCDRCPLTIISACLPCSFGGCAIHMAEHLKACPDNPVTLPPDLAQRILAALEQEADLDAPFLTAQELEALADELRKVMPKEPPAP